MEKTLTVGKTYTVTTASECSVTDSNGLVLCTATAGEQKAFVATTSTIIFSDDSATVTAVFKGAPALGGSGGSGGGSGTPGTPAGFGEVTATATSLAAGSTPTASVATSGFNTAKNFAFSFGIPQGEKGEKGDTGPQGPQGATGTVDTSVLESYATISYVDEAIAAGGGGASITFDSAPTADSTNAVTSGGIYNALLFVSGENTNTNVGLNSSVQNAIRGSAFGVYASSSTMGAAVGYSSMGAYQGTAVGHSSKAGNYSIAMGNGANSYDSSDNSVALGYSTKALRHAIAIGSHAKANAEWSTALGRGCSVSDKGATVIAAWNDDGATQTLLYLMGAGSTLATTYEDGEACIGYVVKDTAGNVSACGTQKLSALFPNNTAWATMALGLDDETPTPFLPTGATDPIEFPEEELTEE